MSLDADVVDWDNMAARFYDNRPFPKDVKPECTLLKPDAVNRPEHYTVGPVEVIDIIKQQQGTAIEFHYEGALLKYVLRWRYKNGVEDLKKARVYLDWLISEKGG